MAEHGRARYFAASNYHALVEIARVQVPFFLAVKTHSHISPRSLHSEYFVFMPKIPAVIAAPS
jgi:hypothetical protein